MKNLIAILSLLLGTLLNAKTVYFVHIGGLDSSKYFYDYTFYRDEVSKPFVLLREAIEKAGYEVKLTHECAGLTDVAAIVSINDVGRALLMNVSRYPKQKCFLLVMEPPIVVPQLHEARIDNYFGKIFNLFDDPVDNRKHFKFYYPQPRLKMIENVPDFSQKKLCTMINCNKDFGGAKSLYPERRKVISFFTNSGEEFDLYGYGWEGYSAWRGTVPAKWETLKNYKFCFCYENLTNQRGYITEKIFDSMVAGCVPIYLGAVNVTDYIPKECFIDRRDFCSEEDLCVFMKNMDRATYESYLVAIRKFFESPKAQVFSSEHFVKLILDSILEANKEGR